MRKQRIEAKNRKEALSKAPWAARLVKVGSLSGESPAWMAFESVEDHRVWKNQK